MLHVNEGTPIYGKTRFMKILYIASQELHYFLTQKNFYHFKQFYFSPYSDELNKDLKQLEKRGFLKRRIQITGFIEENIYSITNYGSRFLWETINLINPMIIEGFSEIKNKYDNIPLSALTEIIYERYPQFLQ